MYRTFHYRVSWPVVTAVVLTAGMAMFFLWRRTTANAALGFLLLAMATLMIERIIHTAYIFDEEGNLVVYRGRFARARRIPLNEVLSARIVRHKLLPVRYVLIEYGAGHFESVQPVGEEAFVRELKKRQELIDKQLNNDEEDF